MVVTWGIPCQTLTPYQIQNKKRFPPLCRSLAKIKGLRWYSPKNMYVIVDLECNIYILDPIATITHTKNSHQAPKEESTLQDKESPDQTS